MNTIKKQKTFIHVVEYYKNSKLEKTIELTDIIDLNKYWENFINIMKKNHGEKFTKLNNYITLSKSDIVDYDYMINKIIENN